MKRIAIVGGGIAGLAAAYELSRMSRNGTSVEATLFEASPQLGGIVETVREGGFVIECGPDAWVTEKPWARELAEELGLGDEILASNDATRKTYVLMDRELKAMPDGMRMMVPANLHALDQSDLFSAEAKQAYHNEIDRATELKAAAPQQDESVAAFVQRHFGNEVLETIGAPLLRGVFGGDVSKLSVRAVMAPFVAMEREHGSLITAIQARTLAKESAALPIFTTLRTGLGTLVDRMIAAIPKDSIRLGTTIHSLSRNGTGWELKTSSTQETFDAVMMAAPVHTARELLHPIDAQTAKLMEMDASSAVIVAFGFPDASQLSTPPGFGFLVPPDQAAFCWRVPLWTRSFQTARRTMESWCEPSLAAMLPSDCYAAEMMKPPQWHGSSWRTSLAHCPNPRSPWCGAGRRAFLNTPSAISSE
jgi:oxygen-dependent protoporphyrinogen oxidase